MKRLLILLLGWFALFTFAFGQRVVGRVVDATTGEAVPFANIFYRGTQVATQSDASGRFDLPFRQGQLLVSSVGYVLREYLLRLAFTVASPNPRLADLSTMIRLSPPVVGCTARET